MFIPGGCFCCDPPEDPCTLSGCTWTSTDMSDTDLTAGTAYYNPVSGVNPDGDYEITNTQETGTGNDAPCRKITIETVSAPHKPDTVYAICWKDDATHNPSTQCPLTSVSFCVESKRHGDSDSGLTDSVVFVVRQNNRIFATTAQSVGVNWKRASGTYTQNSFTEIDGAGNPDFTAAGASIEFGFALKLLVSEDEEPLDVVLFDNLCITKVSTCSGGCNTSSCDWLELGSQALSVTPATGAANYTYGLDGSYGNPQGSHRISVTTSGGGNGQFKQMILYDSGLTVGSLQGSSCQQISNITICLDAIKFSGTGSPYVYFGLYNPTLATYVGGVTASQSIGSGQWRSISASLALPSSAPSGTLVHIIVGSSGSSVFHIDNICVRAVYSDCCCGDDIAITSSVVSIPTPPTIPAIPAVAWADAVASAYNLMNSTVIVPKGTNCGGGDVSLYESGTWSSGGSSGTWRVNKKHSVIRSGASVSISSGFTINMTRVSPSSASTSVAAGITSSVPYSFSQCSVFTGATILNGGWTITGPYTLQAEYV